MIDSIAPALLRTTLCTILSAALATLLLGTMRVRSPAVHRVVWTLVLLQGWAFFPIVLELPIRAASDSAGDVSGIVGGSETSIVSRPSPDIASNGVVPHAQSSVARNLPWYALLWIGGTAIVTLCFIRKYTAMLHLVPLGRAPSNPQWKKEWESIARASKLGAATQFRLTDAFGPLCCFVPFFYLVLAPERLWLTLDRHQRVAILRHELAHLRRRDLWKSAAIRILALPQWFNPLAWKAVRAFDEAAEWACDDQVINTRNADYRTSYPKTLLKIAESASVPLPGSVAVRGGVMTRRIRRIVHPRFMEDTKM